MTDLGATRRDEASAEFFDGAARGQLMIRRCERGHFGAPTTLYCPVCGSDEVSWVPSAGFVAVRPPTPPS